MLCKNPFMKGIIPLGCSQCLTCRINHRRVWSSRLLWERDSHTDAAFVTLTYRDEEVKDVSSADWNASRPVLGTVDPKDVQDWLKRIRKAVYPRQLRYFLVGEYGDETQRPHYHIALFGFPQCKNGRTLHRVKTCCSVCSLVEGTWGKGRIDVGELNKDSCQYIAGYVTKKWTQENQWTKQKLKGRHPEFARMSLKPGIGASAIRKLVSSTVRNRRKGKYLLWSTDAPAALQKGGSTLPLGRYLRKTWRESLGRDPKTPPNIIQQQMQELHKENQEATRLELEKGIPRSFITPKSIYLKKNVQKIRSAESRSKIFKRKVI